MVKRYNAKRELYKNVALDYYSKLKLLRSTNDRSIGIKNQPPSQITRSGFSRPPDAMQETL